MRILEFKVEKQRVFKNPDCDFTNIVANSVGYLYCKFDFKTEDWDKCEMKIASFFVDGVEVDAVKLDENNGCLISKKVSSKEVFEIKITGASKGYSFSTNRTKVKQEVF